MPKTSTWRRPRASEPVLVRLGADEATVLWRWLWGRARGEAEDPALTRALEELSRELQRLLRPFERGAILTDAAAGRARRRLTEKLWTCPHLMPIERWLRRHDVRVSPMAPSRRGRGFWIECGPAPPRDALERAVRIPRGITFRTITPPARFESGESGYVCGQCQCGIVIA